ncbi:YebC/PmpR family DNA-binding transcriptional regulator [Malaciobacter molluscorum LMG 25693]|uniref:Probable transcriptional regulatory protein AMOL_1064 n=1 Tax=Malaciobacter molluscorum LMG 25693 TaxID=870501 RepID=A0A2G1DLD6_9BACT|nr:YebC/PmpR family DNA-binding transcriptional regulator [Malaciobacter molluscorum]AXX92048.1 YebC/PmpR family DNA-binding regulatory protein [Malaciobacter molluscorum LMG 25693]PHO19279.1 YebC/PmpR family DNA-binding transcriptional regulator [Malaciobacter molluscorum LMG 25693]RXJ96459.1 YebC/PmpR family DNA-binding transcriptional regulator [Malaciobacter molluscorum]
MGRAFEYRKAAKMKRWGNMSRVFPKLAKAIEIAAKSGGGDPDMNPALRTAILNAKAQNLPKTNIEAAIKRATGKDAKNYTDVNFEGKGPYGVLIFVECATDNNTRTVANVKMYFNKNGGQVVPTGSLEFMFDRKAIFEFDKTEEMDLEELELELIDSGLEELEEEDGLCIAIADFTDFGNMNTKFEELGIELKKAELKRISNNPQEYTQEQQEEIGKLLEKLEDDDDVQAVFTNIA